MEGADEAMPGEASLHGKHGCGGIADFADGQDLRVLAEDAAQGAFVGELAKGGDFDLGDAGEAALDGVFKADDAEAGLFLGDAFEHAVAGGGFAGARGADEEEHTGVGFNEGVDAFQDMVGEAGHVEAFGLRGLCGEAEDAAYAADGGDDGEAAFQAGVLGEALNGDAAFLRNVEPIGEELGADHGLKDDGAAHIGGKGGFRGETAIDAEADFNAIVGGLKMDVGAAGINGFGEPLIQDVTGDVGGDGCGGLGHGAEVSRNEVLEGSTGDLRFEEGACDVWKTM